MFIRTLFYAAIAIILSAAAIYAGLKLQNPRPAFAAIFGIWALFFWNLSHRQKKHLAKRERERLFEEHMRAQLHRNQRIR